MERKTRSALDSASVPPVFEATQSQPWEVQQKSAGFGSFWKLPFYKCDSPMKMVRAEGAIGWINSGDLLSKRFGGKKGQAFLEGVHKNRESVYPSLRSYLFPSNKLRSTLPPSTCSSVPVVKLESSLDRNRTALATSSASPMRFIGITEAR